MAVSKLYGVIAVFDKWISDKTEKRTGKDIRTPFKGAKSVDVQCRNHGSCPHCQGNRTYFDKKYRKAADNAIKEWYTQ